VDYSIAELDRVLTPALAIYPEIVDANIDFTLELLGHDPNRWRPHVKTSKLQAIMHRLVERGVVNFKCATTLELLTACRAGTRDVLVAYPVLGANAARVRQVAEEFGEVHISALVENTAQVEQWRGSRLGLVIDVNPGMDRTGVPQDRVEDIIALARAITSAGLPFRGLHYYDGHLHQSDLAERTAVAHRGYDQLLRIVQALNAAGFGVGEVITAGTPAFPCTLTYSGFRHVPFIYRASPGTVVYGDATSSAQLPPHYRYRPAVMVVSRVVSQPRADVVTCDAGHKSLSVDCGVPNAVVLGRPELRPLQPSEEHLPIAVPVGAAVPRVGDILYIVPRHVCPTVNNFDHALLVRGGRIVAIEAVSARGREAPLLAAGVVA
jgi:D-serine deaminase-like pyridoxal phosphate-dependent protein